jgi:transposase-like protein
MSAGRLSVECPYCQGQDCIQIEIRLKGEETVQFFSCRRCETKWWERDGDTIDLEEVLHLTAESEAR